MAQPIISSMLAQAANEYPGVLASHQKNDLDRIAFHIDYSISCVAKHLQKHEIELCDLGGGIGLFTLGCARYGLKRTVLIDDFKDAINDSVGEGVLSLHKAAGVSIYSRDVVTQGIEDVPGEFDVITCFDSMEHWHRSPKSLFQQVRSKLRPNGVFFLGVPNCVNLRKRLTIPLGYGAWSSMQDWYEPPIFRGHVREPSASDLKYVAKDMQLGEVTIFGRNWNMPRFPYPLRRIADLTLRAVPTLCSTIYLSGRKLA